MKIQESTENYLETIFMLSKNSNQVRAIDIATALEYSKPSVSVAMKKLRLDGHITIDNNGFITLTENGNAIAQSMYERHTLISNWLISLGVVETTALNDACRIEHVISEQSFLAIKHFIEKTAPTAVTSQD